MCGLWEYLWKYMNIHSLILTLTTTDIQQANLHIHYHKYSYSFRCQIPQVWNSIPLPTGAKLPEQTELQNKKTFLSLLLLLLLLVLSLLIIIY